MSLIFMDAMTDQMLATDKNFPEVSIIMPCLDETDLLPACTGKTRRAINGQK
jgi:hypothetical protein